MIEQSVIFWGDVFVDIAVADLKVPNKVVQRNLRTH